MPNIKKSAKKPTAMAWKDVQSIKFDDKTWLAMNRRFGLSDEARSLIERSVSLYQFHHINHAGFQTRDKALAELKSLEQLMRRLSTAFNKMGDRNVYALIDATQDATKKNAREIWHARLNTLSEIFADIPKAVNIVRGQEKVKTGPNAFAIDHLVKQIVDIIRRYNGAHPSRSKVYLDFMLKAANAADPNITPGVIDAALKRILKK